MDVIAGCSGFVVRPGHRLPVRRLGRGRHRPGGRLRRCRGSPTTDRGTCILFGDGAGAVVLRRGRGRGVLARRRRARSRLLMTPAGGSRFPANSRTVAERRHYIVMEGREVFKGAVTAMAASSLEAIERSGPAGGHRPGRPPPGQPADHRGDRPAAQDPHGQRGHERGPLREHLGRLDPHRHGRGLGAGQIRPGSGCC